jgi:tRNA-2-methylthio-N6-dimethylallyladenosine synthase
VRFTSPHPNDVTPELVEVMATEEAVCEQLHLPLQAGNDRTLKRMLRRHTISEFLQRVDMVRSAVPDMALSTDLIVGFPGETRGEFQDTLSLVRQIRFDDAFTYRFSPRDGTPATRFPADDLVQEAEAKERLSRLIEVTRGIQAEINRSEVGRVEEVLLEKPGREEGFMMGKTRRNKVVVVPEEASSAGRYVEVELISTTGATFVGAHTRRNSPSEST